MAPNLHTSLEESVKKASYAPIYTWQSRERYWTQKDRSWYVMYASFFVLLIAFAAILQEFILIIAIVAFVFLWFVQASIPPEIVSHSITKLGLKTYGKLFKWDQIKHFWFSEKQGVKYIQFELAETTENALPYKRLTLLLENDEDVDLFELLIEKIDYGDKEEISFNPITQIINGRHIDLKEYMPDNFVSQEDYIS